MAKKSKKSAAQDESAQGSGAGELLRVGPGFDLAAVDPDSTPGFSGDKADGEKDLAAGAAELSALQERLFAASKGSQTGDTRNVLLVVQGMDTSGKGGIVRHVVGAADPQGVHHHAFKAPTPEELSHDFLWRIRNALPGPGMLGVFDRSHYEDVLIVRVHNLVPRTTWSRRYATIKRFEKTLASQGTAIVKVMLHISPQEQLARLEERLERPDKYWKYNPGDVDEHGFWPQYQEAYQAALTRTSTDEAPWYVVPANRKWYARWAVQHLLVTAMRGIDPQWPPAGFDVAAEQARIKAAQAQAFCAVPARPGSSVGWVPNRALTAWHDACLGALTGIQNLMPEPRATCGDCVMCAGPGRSGTAVTFRPDVKCCSHIPSIPNFLVGQALSGSGRASAQQRIAARTGVTPLGLGLSHAQVQPIVDAEPLFGRSNAIRCPHYQVEDQSCGLWESRNSVCSTWFCQHERGAVSQRFWQAVRDLLMAAEERLAYRCLSRSGLPEGQVESVLAHRAGIRDAIRIATTDPDQHEPAIPAPRQPAWLDDGPDGYEQLWGDWTGREDAWFLHCASMIEQLSAADLVEWMDGVRHLVVAVHDAWRELQLREPPAADAALAFIPGEGSKVDGDVLRLVGYSPFDPIVVPASLLTPLRLLGREPGARDLLDLLDRDVLGLLADFGVITSAPAAQPADR